MGFEAKLTLVMTILLLIWGVLVYSLYKEEYAFFLHVMFASGFAIWGIVVLSAYLHKFLD